MTDLFLLYAFLGWLFYKGYCRWLDAPPKPDPIADLLLRRRK